jgi:arginyl-tRNA synthetase
MKEELIKVIARNFKSDITESELNNLIENPPDESFGDYALPCFILAKKFRKNPTMIAEEIAKSIISEPIILKAEANSGYCNIFINRKWLSKKVLQQAHDPNYGRGTSNERIVVEYCSPNTNKPLHLGHLRNMAIGESVSCLLDFLGNQVFKTCVYNDRGVHICKSMLAYKDFGGEIKPGEKGIKSDHFVGDFYVIFSKIAKDDPLYETKAQDLLQKWESGDKETVSLWKQMNDWAFEGFRETFQLFGTSFHKEYYESDIYKKGREIVLRGLEQGIFSKRSDGAVIVDLSNKGLDEKVLLRPNSTSVYIVQDIYLAYLKEKDFSYNRSIYVVGNEQEYHFKVLKEILQILGLNKKSEIHHLSYGMVELPEGKMKSREGTVVDADDLIKNTSILAEEEVRKRYQLSDKEISDRALKIALAAIKYQLLKTDTSKNMAFNPKEAIRFEGDTGPYVLYSYARASSILRKSNEPINITEWEVNEYETKLLKKISEFPDVIKLSGERLTPSLLANYGFELSQIFNEFYHECPVLRSVLTGQRLALVSAFRNVIGKCIDLLGIEKIEEM